MTWQPIIESTNPLKQKIATLLREIASEIRESRLLKDDEIGLLSGTSGISLFFIYLGWYTQKDEYFDFGGELLEKSLNAMSSKKGNLSPSYGDGVIGAAWVYAHLQKINFLEPEEGQDDIFSEYVGLYLDKYIDNKCYDLFYGYLGIANYIFELEQPSQIHLAHLKNMLFALDASKIKREKGFVWQYSLEHEKPLVSLGMAHGIPSIIVFLSQLYALGIEKELTFELLEGAIIWVMDQKTEGKSPSSFPSFYSLEGQDTETFSRLAWCYGDLSVARALSIAGRKVGKNEWCDVAIEIALFAANRDISTCGVNDGGLCHGSIGLAIQFNRFYQETGNELFKTTALKWLAHLLDYRLEKEKTSFLHYTYEGSTNTYLNKPNIGFLNGTTGIGLALLSLISDLEPQWDRALLVGV